MYFSFSFFNCKAIFLYRRYKPDVTLPRGCVFICTLGVAEPHHVLSSVIQQNPSASAFTYSRLKVVRAWDPTPVWAACAGRLRYLQIPHFSDYRILLVTPIFLSSTHSRLVTFLTKEFLIKLTQFLSPLNKVSYLVITWKLLRIQTCDLKH